MAKKTAYISFGEYRKYDAEITVNAHCEEDAEVVSERIGEALTYLINNLWTIEEIVRKEVER
jgi:hypothetical protein